MPEYGTPIRDVARRLPLPIWRSVRTLGVALSLVAVTLPGCHLAWWPWHDDPVSEPFADVNLKEYREWANQVDFPDVELEPLPTETFADEPRRVRDRSRDEIWDVTLPEAVHIALSHSHIIRSSGQFLSPGNPILANPDFAPSAYDVAIQESGVLFGQRGVEAALSEFDTQFTTTMTWGRDEQIQNNLFAVGLQPGETLTRETANFDARLQKSLATGGVIGVIHEWDYEWNNITNRLFPSVYIGQLRTEFRQPLLAGAGVEYTRIAGPITQNIQGITGVQQGVVIARINNDISIADFEQSVNNLVRDVEDLYWRLYLAYQQYDAESTLYQEAYRTWRGVNARVLAQAMGGGAIEQTEVRDVLYQVHARREAARNNLYDVEAQLRRMMGLPPNDGRIIRPIDQPMIAEFCPDWQVMLSDALLRRVELRKQKWNIKSLELQLIAAEHLTKPRLDFVSDYRVNGFGNDLLGGQSDAVTTQNLGSAYGTLTDGQQTGWNLGFEFSLPLGMRFAHAQVSNMQIRLAKARAALHAQEMDITHELAAAFRQLDSTYLTMQYSLTMKLNLERRLRALSAVRQAAPDRISDIEVLRARDQAGQAQSRYLQAMTDYNLAIMDLYFRSGTLLGLDNVYLAEGPWTPEARHDAVEKAACRAHSVPTATMLEAEPPPFTRPPVDASFIVPSAAAPGPALDGWDERAAPPGDALQPLPDETPGPTLPEPPGIPPLEPPPMVPPKEIPPAKDKPPYLGPRVEGPQFPSADARLIPEKHSAIRETSRQTPPPAARPPRYIVPPRHTEDVDEFLPPRPVGSPPTRQ